MLSTPGGDLDPNSIKSSTIVDFSLGAARGSEVRGGSAIAGRSGERLADVANDPTSLIAEWCSNGR